jgi:hypothetical protein
MVSHSLSLDLETTHSISYLSTTSTQQSTQDFSSVSSQETTHNSMSTSSFSYGTTQSITDAENTHLSTETTESSEHASTEQSLSTQYLSTITESYPTAKYSTTSEDWLLTTDSELSTSTVALTSLQDSSPNSLSTSKDSSAPQTASSSETAFSSIQTTQPTSQTSTESHITTQEYTEVKQISNGTIKCTCICRHNNHTLEETMELRKRELLVEKTKLSSTVRKLTSAPDVRESSAVMGKLGIAIIVTVAGLLTFVDICSVSLFIYNVLRKQFDRHLAYQEEEISRIV